MKTSLWAKRSASIWQFCRMRKRILRRSRKSIILCAGTAGRKKPLEALEGSAVGNYAERLARTDAALRAETGPGQRIFNLRAHKQQLVQGKSLGQYPRRGRRVMVKPNLLLLLQKRKGQKKEPAYMTQKAYDDIGNRTEKPCRKNASWSLKMSKRAPPTRISKENAPLSMPPASRKAWLDGKNHGTGRDDYHAVIIEENVSTDTAGIGTTVILLDLDSTRECRYSLVGPMRVKSGQRQDFYRVPGRQSGSRKMCRRLKLKSPSPRVNSHFETERQSCKILEWILELWNLRS